MADLSKLEGRGGKQGQASFRRDSFGPRRQTDAPGLEVNAAIGRPNNSGAESLKQILGLANDAASEIGASLGRAQEEKNKKATGSGTLDAALGTADPAAYAKSKAYKKAYDYETATAGAIKLDTTLTEMIQARITDETDPATVEDITKIIDDAFAGYALVDGKARDFGSPEAAMAVATQLGKTRARLVGSSVEVIRNQTNERTLSTIASNIVFERVQMGSEQPLVPAPGDAIAPSEDAPAAATSELDAWLKKPVTGKGGAASEAAPAAPARKWNIAPNGYVATTDLRNLFKGEKGYRYGGGARSAERNREVHGVANSQHIGSSNDVTSALDMGDVSVARAKEVLKANGLTGEVIRHDAGNGMHTHIESVKPIAGGTAPAKPDGPQPDPKGPEPLPTRSPPVDFEEYLARVPVSIPRGDAKKYLLGALIQAADENGDDKLMDGLWQSKRADGTPSFSPQEIGLLREERDRIREKKRVEGDRRQKEMWTDNADIILKAEVDDKPASEATIRQWVDDGRLDPQFGLSIIRSRESEAKQEARIASAEAKEASRAAEVDIDVDIASQADLVRTGAVRGNSPEDIRAAYDRGDYGVGKRAAARYRTMLAAYRQGSEVAVNQPEVAVYAERIRAYYGPKKGAQGGRVAGALNGGQGKDPIDYSVGIISEFRRLVKAGEEPAKAYVAAVAAYGRKDDPNVKNAKKTRLRELEQRAKEGR